MSDTVTIVSLAPYQLGESHHELGNLSIPAREKGQPFAKLVVTDKTTTKDFGEGRKEPVVIKAKDVAEDIVGIHKDSSLLQHGVFIAAGDEPTDKELAKAKKTMETFYHKQIDDADSQWVKKRDRKQINFHAFVAADYFNVRKEWAIDLSEMVPCPSCKELISPEAIKCPKCMAITDADKALQFFMITPEQHAYAKANSKPAPKVEVPEEVVKRPVGRPRKDA